MADTDPSSASGTPYRVLARKYRPSDFSSLIGQEALVQTLTNAFRVGRIAQAFMLTGVRGVGKTTTARIIARALNCVGPDGTGGPTVTPCGVCEPCRAIAEDRHVDVLEMDAASRTGVGDIREIIDGVRYRPTSARFKVYIIDEVHMLSNSAFNALLKTLEEPPAHATFVFATTEVRKVPVTVLSRCQRFDLRRIDAEVLAAHFTKIAEKEGITADAEAIRLIARAADGSVRDGLSLLDQAIAHAGDGGLDGAEVRAMLGLADREATFDVLEAVLAGDAARALDSLARQYEAGADPVIVVQDLLELVHWLTRIKVVPATADAPEVPEAERVRGRALAESLAMPVLTRAWQMLFKGLSEVQAAEAPLGACEMVLIRLAYAASLPTPDEALRTLANTAPTVGTPASAAPAAPMAGTPVTPTAGTAAATAAPRPAVSAPTGAGASSGMADPRPTASRGGAALAGIQPRPETTPTPETAAAPEPALPDPSSFAEVVDLAAQLKEGELYAHLTNSVHVVRFQSGRIDFRPGQHAPQDLASRLMRFLGETTGKRWVVSIANDAGEPTLAETRAAERAARHADVARHPLVRAVFAAFPGAVIAEVRDGADTDASDGSETGADATDADAIVPVADDVIAAPQFDADGIPIDDEWAGFEPDD